MKIANLIICTFNRSKFLEKLLERLSQIESQHPYSVNFDTTIILNACTDNSEEVCNSYRNRIKDLFVYNEPTQGLSHARNKGISVSNHEWCIYLDDDGFPDLDFFKECYKTIKTDLFDCFGGYYYPDFETPPPKWIPSDFGSNRKDLQNLSLLNTGYASGGILAIKKSVFTEVGEFKSELGVQGNLRLVGEETELQNRMRAAKMRIGYNPNWRMSHFTPRIKCSFLWNVKNLYLDSKSTCAINAKNFSKLNVIKNIRRKKYLIPLLIKRWREEPAYYWQNLALDYLRAILKQ